MNRIRQKYIDFYELWGFELEFLKIIQEGFEYFFQKDVSVNLLKSEFLIPSFIGELLKKGNITVDVLKSNDTWYGMTYQGM